MKHKVVGLRMEGEKDGVRISSLTESPRGTRVLSGSRNVSHVGKDKAAFKAAIAVAVEQLLDGVE